MLLFHRIGLDSSICAELCCSLTACCNSSDQDLNNLHLSPTSAFTQRDGPISGSRVRKEGLGFSKASLVKGKNGVPSLAKPKCRGIHKSLCRSLCVFSFSRWWAQTRLATQHPICKALWVSSAPSQRDGSWYFPPTLCSTLLKSWAQTDALAKKKKKLRKEKSKRGNIIFLCSLCWVGEWALAAGGALLLV